MKVITRTIPPATGPRVGRCDTFTLGEMGAVIGIDIRQLYTKRGFLNEKTAFFGGNYAVFMLRVLAYILFRSVRYFL